MSQEQRVSYFSGTVQGVGFRYMACRVAEGFDVSGYVRNLSDGRVECLVEGTSAEVDAFLDELARQMRGYVREVQQQKAPYTGNYSGFTVKF